MSARDVEVANVQVIGTRGRGAVAVTVRLGDSTRVVLMSPSDAEAAAVRVLSVVAQARRGAA